jgi:hypothetical protein
MAMYVSKCGNKVGWVWHVACMGELTEVYEMGWVLHVARMEELTEACEMGWDGCDM